MAGEDFSNKDVFTLDEIPDLDNFEFLFNEVIGAQPLDDDHPITIGTAAEDGDVPIAKAELSGAIQETYLKPIANVSTDTEMPHSSNCYRTSLPASQNWPGDYEFTVSLESQEKSRNVAWTYSNMTNRLYIAKDSFCPFSFSANAILPKEAVIRATVVYSSPQYMAEVVRRCATHAAEEVDKDIFEAYHLIRCKSRKASYEIDPGTFHLSVVVPFENPAAGQQHSTYLYKFTCFGSCSGGPNRRPIAVVFTLEKDNQVHGRRKFDVKICACPGRDRKSEDNHLTRAAGPSKRKHPVELVNLFDTLEFTRKVPLPSLKKTKVSPNKDEQYLLATNNLECYEFLQQMKTFFELSKFLNKVPDDVMSLFMQQKKDQQEN